MEAAARGGVNFVRVYFYGMSNIPADRKRALVALAYSTARDQLLAPKAILIRSDLHGTTSMQGRHVPDPKGFHCTLAFKSEDQLLRKYHVASHGYTNSKDNFVLKEATHTPEKADDTARGGRRSGKVVWPPMNELEEYVDSPIGYSHLPKAT